MPQGGADRRLATVLFLDVVGSTRIASDVGDQLWRELLGRFRRIVRTQLKQHGGREENFTGDGFLATFQEPVRAIRAGTGIAAAVHELGIEVRSGLHTGECERIEGSLGGIAVHIASRVMSLSGPAEVLVTSTVRELVTGSGIEFEDFSAHELKGVPGTWRLFAVQTVDGAAVEKPLPAEDAAGRIAAIEAPPFLRRRRRVLVGAGALLAGAIALSLILLTGGGGTPKAATTLPGTITLVRLDPTTNKVVEILRDRYYSHHLPGSLWSADGSLWQFTGDAIVRRDIETGESQLDIPVGAIRAGAPGFGSAWTAIEYAADEAEIDRYDEATGRLQRKIRVPDVTVVSMSAGNGAMWALGSDGKLVEINPATNKIANTYTTKTYAPGIVVALAGYVWICDCEVGKVVQFDPRKDAKVRTIKLPEHGFLVDVDTEHGHTVWMLDPSGNTLTPIDPESSEVGQPIGFGGHLGDAKIGFGALWVAASNAVYRIDLSTHQQKLIPIPLAMTAGSIALDQRTGSVWVGNCGCPRNG